MPSLGLDTMPAAPPDKTKRWNTVLTVGLGAMIAFFVWVVVSNLYLLYFGKPLINLH